MWHCWACNAGGRLRSLSVLHPDELNANVEPNVEQKVITIPDEALPISLSKEGVEYLNSRGVNEQDIRQLGVLYNKGDVYIPYYESDKLVAFNVRGTNGRWTFVGESRESLFYIIYGKTEYVIICEGFFDGVKLMQLGHSVFILFGKLLYEKQLNRLLQIFDKFILALDSDEWGRRATLKIVKQLEQHLPSAYLLRVPDGRKDFGECTNEEIKGLMVKKLGLVEKLNLKVWK